MAEKKSNTKVIWYILFALVTVILCYLFTVVYFFYISPYNTSLKISFWPFLSDQAIGEMYLDATVEIDFTVNELNSLEQVDKSVVGVNVTKEGYVIAPYNEFRDCTIDTKFDIFANSGEVYTGKLLYNDKNYNIAVLKCESKTGKDVKLPYVKLGTVDTGRSHDVLAIASPMKSKFVWTGVVTDTQTTTVYKEIEIDGSTAVEFVVEECYTVDIENVDTAFTGGAIFDKNGSLLGLSYEKTLNDGSYVIMPVNGIENFLSEVIDGYKTETVYTNKLVESFIGFDQVEIYCYMETSNTNYGKENSFYFQNEWQVYSDGVELYSNSEVAGYYLFDDVNYDGSVVLAKDNVVFKISQGKTTYNIDDKLDLLNVLYNSKSGDTLTLFYYDTDNLGTRAKTVTFEV